MQEWGGVGYYPTSGVPFVHVDTGRVRMWPRIPRLELAALFPDGQTKYLPIDGKPITPRDYQWPAKAKQRGETLVAAATPVASPTAQPAAERDVEAPQPILAIPHARATACASRADRTAPTRKRFVYASASGELPKPASHLSDENFPLYRSAEVVGAPEVDEEHPEELSYVPFEIASLMTDVSVTYNPAAATLTPPENGTFPTCSRTWTGRWPPPSAPRRVIGLGRRAELHRPRGAERLCRACASIRLALPRRIADPAPLRALPGMNSRKSALAAPASRRQAASASAIPSAWR